jgi:hypothetical protein
MSLSVSEIEERLEEAAWTLRRLPEKDRPRGYGSSWPPIVRDAKHAYGYTPQAPMRVVPSAAAITRMEECFDWLMMIDPEDARIVWLRAENVRWKQICIRAGVVRSTAWRRWVAALMTISKKLERQAKTARKPGAGKAPAALNGTAPRASRAEQQDNAHDTLNFGRDTSKGFGAEKA